MICFLLRVVRSTALYVLAVDGAFLLFMVVAPVFGYLPYSDRPGPGWFGTFPAVGWTDFWQNAAHVADFASDFATGLAFPGVLASLLMHSLAAARVGRATARVLGGVATTLLTAFMMAGLGWSISLGGPGLLVTVAAGLLFSVVCLPRQAHSLRA